VFFNKEVGKVARAAYFAELREAIKAGKIRERPESELLEVREFVEISVSWKIKVKVKRGGKTIREFWREFFGVVSYEPGDVLHPLWRQASEWEEEEWRDLPPERLKELGVFRKDGQFSVQIVSKIKDLPAAVRQRIRHIPASLIGRERKEFILAGNAQLLADYARRLNNLIDQFLAKKRVSPELMEKASVELSRIYELLERSRTFLKRKALEDIELASQGKFWERPGKIIQVSADLLNQRALDYEMAFKSIVLGEKWLRLMLDSERRFRHCYNRLGELAMKLQDLLSEKEIIELTDLRPIAKEAHGILNHLNREVHFNPYYQRLQTPEFQRLSHVQMHAEAGRGKTVLNSIKLAAVKLEAVAIGERVTRAEARKEKEALF
jgi:hypothetical protein